MKVRNLIIGFASGICLVSCQHTDIPKSAFVTAENENVAVFLNHEDDNEIPQVSLWLRYKETNNEKRLLITHPHARRDWRTYTGSVRIPVDSIATISRVTIISYGKEPVKLLVEGCPDYRNVESFIVSENCKDAICLPTANGLLGITEEESLLIMESYEYYEEGGRYSKIDAFTRDGNLISSMSPKLNHKQ